MKLRNNKTQQDIVQGEAEQKRNYEKEEETDG